MATTGPALYPGTNVFPGTDVYPGQGDLPLARVLYSKSDVADTSPVWIDASSQLRSWSTGRGRSSELEEVDAGTAQIVLDNRTRMFDPIADPDIRPMNRWRIYEESSSEIQDVFTGYAESYDQGWSPGGKTDAATTVRCVDEFKILALDRLPVMSPPRDTYDDLVNSDIPGNYWTFSDHSNLAGNPGPGWYIPSSGGSYTTGPVTAIVGESGLGRNALAFQDTGGSLETTNDAFDTQGTSAVTVEFWFKFDVVPAAPTYFVLGRVNAAGSARNFSFRHETSGAVRFAVTNTSPTESPVFSPALSTDTWYHIVGTHDGANVKIYINGAPTSAASAGGNLAGGGDDVSTTVFPELHGTGPSAGDFIYIAKLAFYPSRDLGQDRITAHYQAGRQRGFVHAQSPLKFGTSAGIRAESILDAAGSFVGRVRDGGSTRVMTGSFMRGQDVLSELRTVFEAEAPDGVLFISRSGEIVMLGAEHRAVSPWNTVQATFDDDGTDLKYVGLEPDYSEAFLINEWTATAKGSQVTATASDATSIDRYWKRSRPLTDIPVTTDGYASDIATALLAKYKDPLQRIKSITVLTDNATVAETLFRLEIADRVRIFRRPPGGGTPYDQTSFIQSIAWNAPERSKVWQCRLGVSPV